MLVNCGQAEWHERVVGPHIDGANYPIATADLDFYIEELAPTTDGIQSMRFYRSGGVLPPGIDGNNLIAFGPMPQGDRTAILRELRQMAIMERARLGVPALHFPSTITASGIGIRRFREHAPAAVAMAAAQPRPVGGVSGGAATAKASAPAVHQVVLPLAHGLGGLLAAAAPVPPPGPLPMAGPVLAKAANAGAHVPRRTGRKPEAQARVAPPGGVWVIDEPGVELDIGDEVALPDGALVLDGRAIGKVDGEGTMMLKQIPEGESIDTYISERRAQLSDDYRTLSVGRAAAQDSVNEAINDMVSHEDLVFPEANGPRTAEWLLRRVATSHRGGFVQRHHQWVRDASIPSRDRSQYEHQCRSRTLDLMIQRDRLNCTNLASAEVVCRRLQLIEEVHREDPDNPDWSGANLYEGDDEQKGGALIAPSLRAHVSTEMSRSAMILKEKRKAKEAVTWARGQGRGGKGPKGQGKDQAGNPKGPASSAG